MGVLMRRYKEKIKQATGMQSKSFQPTSNIRCATMYKEASDFAAHLKKCQTVIANLKVATDNMLTTTKAAMSAPLPHLFEETAAGAGGELKPVVPIGGPGFQGDVVMRLSQQANAQIESQVLVPIKRWLEVYTAVGPRLKEVEALRLEVDSRRKTVIDLAAQVDKSRAKLAKQNGASAKVEGSLDESIKKLQHKEGKLALTVQSFQEKEEAVHADLSTLITDAAWLRHYMASALRANGDALIGASKALGDTESSVQGAAPPTQNNLYSSTGGQLSPTMASQQAQANVQRSVGGDSNPFLNK